MKHVDKGTALAGAPAASKKPVPPGSVRVTYVPDTVRAQIAAEVKQQVMQQAQEEGWAEPNTVPGWAQRIHVYGDIRIRPEFDMFSKKNFPLVTDYNTINNSSNGYDPFNPNTPIPPLLNVTQNRTRVDLRARVGVVAQIADWITSDILIATGTNTSPTSTNQFLGTPGEFQKYAVWLDLAYLDLHPNHTFNFLAGRSPNPYWLTTLMFDREVNFDGFTMAAQHAIGPNNVGFFTTGAYPVFNTAFNLTSPTTGIAVPSHNSWLFAAQAGDAWHITPDYDAKAAVAFFDYVNLQGKLSSPCPTPIQGFGQCDTDLTRAPYVVYGNTLFPIRNVVQTTTTLSDPQFFGLASRFGILDLHSALTYHGFHPIDVLLEGEYADNLAFDRSRVAQLYGLNFGGTTAAANSTFAGGNTAYAVRVAVGHLELEKAWDWNSEVTYKYLASDSVIDAFADSHFHLGGTNAKGYQLRSNLALAKDFWMSAELDSTNAASGPSYSVNTVYLEMNAKF
jgi:hypothetical protein